MLNIGGGELLVIMLVALMVLGPAKLPEAARQVGKVASELRRMSSSFQNELRTAMDEPTEQAARDRGTKVVGSEQDPAPGVDAGHENDAKAATDAKAQPAVPPTSAPEPAEEISTAEAAGMYDAPSPDSVADKSVAENPWAPDVGANAASTNDNGAEGEPEAPDRHHEGDG